MRIKKNNTREEFKIPKSVKDTIPVNRIYKDGIFLLSKDKYSKTFKFTDINYAVAGKQDKEAMFLNYSEILNSFDTGANTKITVLNRSPLAIASKIIPALFSLEPKSLVTSSPWI